MTDGIRSQVARSDAPRAGTPVGQGDASTLLLESFGAVAGGSEEPPPCARTPVSVVTVIPAAVERRCGHDPFSRRVLGRVRKPRELDVAG